MEHPSLAANRRSNCFRETNGEDYLHCPTWLPRLSNRTSRPLSAYSRAPQTFCARRASPAPSMVTRKVPSAHGSLPLPFGMPLAPWDWTTLCHRRALSSKGKRFVAPAKLSNQGWAHAWTLLFSYAQRLSKGHAFPGVWLKPEEFSSTVVDDITALRKRVKLKEMVLFESTLLVQRPLPKFSFTVVKGEERISEAEEGVFELAVDIRRARLQRIKPLASENAILRDVNAQTQRESVGPPWEEAPPHLDSDAEVPAEVEERPEDRISRWQRKLLDLSLRNNLLNFKSGKKSVKLDAPEPGAVEDVLAEGHGLKLLSRPDLMDGDDPRNKAIHEAREREHVHRQRALDALKRKEVFVGLTQDELDKHLLELYRNSRATLQEGGSNTLFLALGFLSYTENAKDDKKYRAPLILLPVSLERRSARSGFSIKLHDDEARFNPTLIQMLRQDHELELGIRDANLPQDDAGLDVAGIWKTVSHAIKDIPGWEVVEDVVLASFSFAKYLMWRDLTERMEKLKQNPVVRHLIDTPRDAYQNTVEFPDPRHLDSELPVKETLCPLPADSSQLSAMVAGSKGKDYVLIGPPGTGKSQTISNLIAQFLAERKRVLFVSEKMAALDVVYRRLVEVGLGNFCLELHSSKARKTDVLEQLRTSWDAGAALAPDDWHAEAARLEALRSQLNGYVERLHVRHPNGLSVYEAIGRVVGGRDFPRLRLSWSAARVHDAQAMRDLRQTADLLDVNARAFGATGLTASPLSHVVRHRLKSHESVFPQASEYDWRFVLRPDAKAISDSLRQAVPLVEHSRL